MTRLSVVERNIARAKKVKHFLEKRKALKQIIGNKLLDLKTRYESIVKLQKLPRDSSAVRLRNRCAITGRGRGCYRDFSLSRNKLRELASFREIPGLVKSSW